MQGFRTIVPQTSRDKVISSLHEIGVAQFREVSVEEVEKEKVQDEYYEINSVLSRMEEVREFFETADLDTELEIDDYSIEKILESSRELLEEIEPKMQELDSRIKEIQEKREELKNKTDILSKLSEIDLPLRYLQSTENVEIVVGQILEEEVDEFIGEIEETLADEVFVISLGKGNTRIVVLACRRDVVSELRPIQYKFGVESLELPESDKTPEEFLEDIDEKLEEYDEKEKQVQERIKEVSKDKGDRINAFTEILKIEQERQESLQLFGRTDQTTIIEGWALEDKIDKVEKTFAEATDESYIMKKYEPSELSIEDTPVKLENSKLYSFYEYLTEMYSLPSYDSTDPTLLVAISFSIFFGFTLSDAGYGLVIFILMISGISFVNNMFSKRLRYVLMAGALGTIFAGALFGSWFGGVLGEHISIFSELWVKPIDKANPQPIPFLKLVVYMGILHLAAGYGICAVRKNVIRKNWKKLVLDNIGSTLLLFGLFLIAFCVVGVGTEFGVYFPELGIFKAFNPLASVQFRVRIFQGIFYGGMFMTMIGQITQEGASMMDKVGGVVNSVYSVIDYISNVVSYTRILALGAATSVIALVINEIATMFFNGLYPSTFTGPVSYLLGAVGIIGLVLVVVLGHAFNIFINSITGFVHVMRLQYAEFFQTFYEAGGKEYSPFKLIRKYT